MKPSIFTDEEQLITKAIEVLMADVANSPLHPTAATAWFRTTVRGPVVAAAGDRMVRLRVLIAEV